MLVSIKASTETHPKTPNSSVKSPYIPINVNRKALKLRLAQDEWQWNRLILIYWKRFLAVLPPIHIAFLYLHLLPSICFSSLFYLPFRLEPSYNVDIWRYKHTFRIKIIFFCIMLPFVSIQALPSARFFVCCCCCCSAVVRYFTSSMP